MSPKTLVRRWLSAFNAADADALAGFYREDGTLHKVGSEPVTGRDSIRAMFAGVFATPTECLPENLFEEGEWAILEWRDPTGAFGASLYHVIDGKIALQRSY